jgi:hypothetical protein
MMTTELHPKTSLLPYRAVHVGNEEPIEQGNLMEFRLLYQGEIKSSGNGPKPESVHAIRKVFHPQLRRQWQVHSVLRQFAGHLGDRYNPISLDREQERFDHGITEIGKKWKSYGYEFVPMLTSDQFIKCTLEILLLRPEEERLIFKQGDIDGQIKTLFDALRLPTSPAQAGSGPGSDETPFFCLLEDDRMISEVKVTADQLLLLPSQREVQANDAFAVVHVRFTAKYPGALGNWLA